MQIPGFSDFLMLITGIIHSDSPKHPLWWPQSRVLTVRCQNLFGLDQTQVGWIFTENCDLFWGGNHPLNCRCCDFDSTHSGHEDVCEVKVKAVPHAYQKPDMTWSKTCSCCQKRWVSLKSLIHISKENWGSVQIALRDAHLFLLQPLLNLSS